MAAQKLAKAATDKAKPVPDWTQRFRCHVIKADTTVDDREVIAGKTQALQETVRTRFLFVFK